MGKINAMGLDYDIEIESKRINQFEIRSQSTFTDVVEFN